VRSALLRGREHLDFGAIDTIAEGDAAIALSPGGARKSYPHTDPNEDAAAFAIGAGGTLVAVADGHRGFEASEVLLEHLIAHPAPQWTLPGGVDPAAWPRHALAALCDANAEVLRERVARAEGGSRTTLALALALPARGTLLYAAIGDSHLFRVGPGGVVDLADAGDADAHFLGHGEETTDGLAGKCRIDAVPLGDALAFVLATDGISEHHVGLADPAAAVREAVEKARSAAPDLRALEAARRLVEMALDAHRRNPSGDNIAVAVLWNGGSGDGARR
jgi:serine/threonine protein phosphatase PrpC